MMMMMMMMMIKPTAMEKTMMKAANGRASRNVRPNRPLERARANAPSASARDPSKL